jgi:hypothetical protein
VIGRDGAVGDEVVLDVRVLLGRRCRGGDGEECRRDQNSEDAPDWPRSNIALC